MQAHADRTEPIAWLADLVPGFSRLMGDDDDPSACFALHPSRADVTLPLVAAGRSADDVSAVEAWLDALHDDLAAGRAPAHDFSAPHPLLRRCWRGASSRRSAATTPRAYGAASRR